MGLPTKRYSIEGDWIGCECEIGSVGGLISMSVIIKRIENLLTSIDVKVDNDCGDEHRENLMKMRKILSRLLNVPLLSPIFVQIISEAAYYVIDDGWPQTSVIGDEVLQLKADVKRYLERS